jgi:hypothetical protein
MIQNIDQSLDESLDESKSNGLITKIWGPCFWETLHCVSAGYPLEPTDTDKKNYKDFYISVKNVLPCKFCRESYDVFITKENDTLIDDNVFESREKLMLWVYKLHERVNLKLGMTYNVTFDEVKDRLESFRAKCIKGKKTCAMPLNLKANSFGKAEQKNAPVINLKFYESFKTYAKKRGVEFNDEIIKLLKLKHNNEIWIKRDEYCVKLIKKMRLEGIPSVEPKGEYKNLPTFEELKLVKMLSTNICCEELEQINKMLKEKGF